MNLFLFRHELKLMIQSRKNILFLIFFLIAIFSYIFIILPKEEGLESFDAENVSAEVKELEVMQKGREGRRHTGGGFSSISFYSSNNYKYILNRGMLQAFDDKDFNRLAYLRTFYLTKLLEGEIFEDEMFQDSDYPAKDLDHYLNKKLRENEVLLQSEIPITYEMIEEKTVLQTMKNIFLSFGPFLLLFSAIYFSNDILIRDREQTSTVQGMPISWYQYINTKSIVAFAYTIFILLSLLTITVIVLTFSKGFGSFQMGVPILSIIPDGPVWFIYEYGTISMIKYFALTLSFAPIFMYIFIRVNMIFSLLFKNEWVVILLSSFLLFSERLYYARDKRTLFNIGIDKFPQSFFDFGKIVTGEKNFLLNMNELTYGKGIVIMFISLIVVEILLLLAAKLVTKERFFNV